MGFGLWHGHRDREVLECFGVSEDALGGGRLLAALLAEPFDGCRTAIAIYAVNGAPFIVEGSYAPAYEDSTVMRWEPVPLDLAELGRRAAEEIPLHLHPVNPWLPDDARANGALLFWRLVHGAVEGWGGPRPPPVDEAGIRDEAREARRMRYGQLVSEYQGLVHANFTQGLTIPEKTRMAEVSRLLDGLESRADAERGPVEERLAALERAVFRLRR